MHCFMFAEHLYIYSMACVGPNSSFMFFCVLMAAPLLLLLYISP